MPSYNGTDDAEAITGTDQNDTIRGNGGNDQISGGLGNDELYGGTGDDLILGDSGNDRIWGDSGNDVLAGGAGSDSVYGGTGDDDIYFGAGDSVYGEDGSDLFILETGGSLTGALVVGGLGFDIADFTRSTDTLSIRMNDAVSGAFALAGIERLGLGSGGGTVYGGSVGEEIFGGSGAVTVFAGAGNDVLGGGSGNDTLRGEAGDDLISGGMGNDVLDGGEGFDTLTYVDFQNLSVTIDLSLTGAQQTGYGLDTLIGFEAVIAGGGMDRLRGSAGDDLLDGGGWDDTIAGGAGNDTLIGGDGSDTADYSRATSGVTVSLALQGAQNTGGDGTDTLTGFEKLTGSGFDDVLTGDAGSNAFITGAGSDRVVGGGGYDTVSYEGYGAANNGNASTVVEIWKDINQIVYVRTGDGSIDTLIDIEGISFPQGGSPGLATDQIGLVHQGTDLAETLIGGNGGDTIRGGGGDDIIRGNAATAAYDLDNILYGEAGNDTLLSASGRDKLYGGDGNDVLNGGAGQDELRGGAGDDTYIFDATDGIWDVVVENVNEGIDTYFSSSTIRMADNVEKLFLTGSASIFAFGNSSANEIVGNSGNNTIYGGTGSDLVLGGDGDDTLFAAGEYRTSSTAGDTDILHGGLGADTLTGGEGADRLFGEQGNDVVNAGFGNDTIEGGDGLDVLTGEQGDDIITGGSGADILRGNDGSDTLTGGTDNDELDGGLGLDVAVFNGPRSAYAVTVYGPVVTVTGPDGVDTLTSIEKLIFSDGEMSLLGLVGTEAADTLAGTAGDDYLWGAQGDDILLGSAGNDLLDGAEGRDTVDYRDATSGVTIDLTITAAQTVNGGQGTDRLVSIENVIGSQYADRLWGGVGNRLEGGGGDDVLENRTYGAHLFGGDGADTVRFNQGQMPGFAGQVFAGTIDGGSGIDTLDLSSASSDLYIGQRFSRFSLGFGGQYTSNSYTLSNVEHYLTGSGNDTVDAFYVEGSLYVDSGMGNDTINTSYFASGTLHGGGGDDTISATSQFYTIAHGGDGNDFISFGDYTDAFGDAGNDTFRGHSGSNITGSYGIIDGGAGNDTLEVFANESVNLATGFSGVGTRRIAEFTSIENVTVILSNYTSSFGAMIVGSDVANVMTTRLLDYYVSSSIDFAGMGGDDVLIGNNGNDKLDGGVGNDTLTGGAGNDIIEGGLGTDTAVYTRARAAYSIIVSGNVATVTGPDGTDTLTNVEFLQFADQKIELALPRNLVGTDGADILEGGANNDTLTGGLGDDLIDGGAGSDTAIVSGAGVTSITLNGNVLTVTGPDGVDQLTNVELIRVGELELAASSIISTAMIGTTADDALFGTSTADRLYGRAGSDTLNGGDGNDVLRGGAGNDILIGGAGVDTADYGGAAGGVVASLTAGSASSDGDGGSDGLSGIENLIGSAFADQLTGSGGDNSLSGGAGADTLLGLAGDDIIAGGAGNDVLDGGSGIDLLDYSGASAGVRAQFNTGTASNDGDGGSDTISGFENLTGSAFDDLLVGDGGANIIRGGLGTDLLIGGAGNDTIYGGTGAGNELYGGTGDDLFILEANDTVVEFAGEGIDTVEVRIGVYNLGTNLERLVYTGTASFTGTGNSADNTLIGGAGDDVLRGRGGNDELIGGAGLDTADYTQATASVLVRLDSVITLNDGEGGQDYLTSIENITGSQFNDVVVGNGGANVLRGGLGSDVLLGGAGDDILYGGEILQNELHGGMGNDYFVLDVADTVIENAGEGIDTVESRVSTYTLAANVENLIYTGPASFSGWGNGLDNRITGGVADDYLRGMGGNDTIDGGLGTDTLYLRGLAADYTITAEGTGWRIVDAVSGRDGSTFVTSIEQLQYSNNSIRVLTYPPSNSGTPASDKDADQPQVSRVLDDLAPSAKVDPDGPQVQPSVLDIAEARDGHDLPQVLPGLIAVRSDKDGADQPLVQPGSLDDDFLDLKVDTDSVGPQIQPGVFDDMAGVGSDGPDFSGFGFGGGSAGTGDGDYGFRGLDPDIQRALDDHNARLDHMPTTNPNTDPWA